MADDEQVDQSDQSQKKADQQASKQAVKTDDLPTADIDKKEEEVKEQEADLASEQPEEEKGSAASAGDESPSPEEIVGVQEEYDQEIGEEAAEPTGEEQEPDQDKQTEAVKLKENGEIEEKETASKKEEKVTAPEPAAEPESSGDDTVHGKKEEEEGMEIDKQTILTGVFILLGLMGLFGIARFVVPRALVYLTRATRPTKFSLSNSYVFGAPLSVPADGETKIRVSAFLLNDEGRGVPDKTIDIQAEPKGNVEGNLQLNSVQPTTDKFGKAVFEVTSMNSGQYEVTALVDGVEFPQSVTLTFR